MRIRSPGLNNDSFAKLFNAALHIITFSRSEMRKRSGGGGGRGLEDTPFDPKLHTDSFLTSYLNSFNFVELNLGTVP